MATVKELRAELEALEVEIPSGARKADLEALLETHGPTEAPPAVEEGGIDPRLVADRDAVREVEARTRVGRVRPTPVSIDPRLVEIREETRQADAESVKAATEPIER